MRSHRPSTAFGGAALGIGKDVRMAADQLGGDGLDHVAEIEGALLLGHAGMEGDLEQKVAQLVLEVVQVAARDGVGHLVGFLERIGRDGLEVCSRSQGQPLPGVRSAAMISISRAMSREGFTGLGLVAAGKTDRSKARPGPRPRISMIRIRHIMEYY